MHNMHVLNVILISHVLFSAIKPTNITYSSVRNKKQVQWAYLFTGTAI